MAEHNQFEVDNAWETVEVTSRYGDKATYRINAITQEVLIKTNVGDGNAALWRGSNSTYDAIKKQSHVVVSQDPDKKQEKPTVEPPLVAAAVVAPVVNNNGNHLPKAEPLDLESVAPFGKPRRGKHSD